MYAVSVLLQSVHNSRYAKKLQPEAEAGLCIFPLYILYAAGTAMPLSTHTAGKLGQSCFYFQQSPWTLCMLELQCLQLHCYEESLSLINAQAAHPWLTLKPTVTLDTLYAGTAVPQELSLPLWNSASPIGLACERDSVVCVCACVCARG